MDEGQDMVTLDGEILPVASQEVSPAIAAEINQGVATAKRYPRRGMKEIADAITSLATLDEKFAAECMYTLDRGGKAITGPSIRFAEMVRSQYGNIRVAARFVRIDADDPERAAVIVEAVALDMQNNQSEIIPNRRSIMTSGKYGKKPTMYSADMINMTVNAATSLARRNAILAVVPKAIWIGALHRVVKVLQGDAATLDTRRREMITAFGRKGVAESDVLAALGVKAIEDITLEHMPAMAGFVTAIAEGETPASVFGRATAAVEHEKVHNPLRDEPDEGPKPGGKKAEPAKQAASAPDEATGGDAGRLPIDPDEDENPAPRGQDAASAGKKAEPKPQQTGPADGLADIATPEAYEAHAMAWIAAAERPEAIRAQWAKERAKRGSLGLDETTLARITAAYSAKQAELKTAEKG